MTPSTADADWSAYYRMTSGRPPRDLVRKGLLAAGRVGTAVDLGCGDGTETLWLLEQGWQVLAVDREPSAVELVQKRAGGAATLRTAVADLVTDEIPAADLVLACASLPFVPPEAFGDVWRRIRSAARGGVLAVHLFGDRDSWASGPSAVAGMTFHRRAEVEQLLTGLEVVSLDEAEYDGPSGRGPKHWHRYDIVARG